MLELPTCKQDSLELHANRVVESTKKRGALGTFLASIQDLSDIIMSLEKVFTGIKRFEINIRCIC